MVCFWPGGGRATAERGPRRKGRTWPCLCSGPGLSFPSYSYVFRITDTGDRLVAGLVSQTEQQEQVHGSRMFSAGTVSTCVASLPCWAGGLSLSCSPLYHQCPTDRAWHIINTQLMFVNEWENNKGPVGCLIWLKPRELGGNPGMVE